jgi:hypothetical protein
VRLSFNKTTSGYVLCGDGYSERFSDLIFKNTTDLLSKSHVSINNADLALSRTINSIHLPSLQANEGRATILTLKEERLAIIAVLADGRWNKVLTKAK